MNVLCLNIQEPSVGQNVSVKERGDTKQCQPSSSGGHCDTRQGHHLPVGSEETPLLRVKAKSYGNKKKGVGAKHTLNMSQ